MPSSAAAPKVLGIAQSVRLWGVMLGNTASRPGLMRAVDLQVEHWKEQAGLSPEKRQMVDLTDVLDERWKNPDLDQQSVYSPKPN